MWRAACGHEMNYTDPRVTVTWQTEQESRWRHRITVLGGTGLVDLHYDCATDEVMDRARRAVTEAVKQVPR